MKTAHRLFVFFYGLLLGFDQTVVAHNVDNPSLIPRAVLGCAGVIMRNRFGQAARLIQMVFENPCCNTDIGARIIAHPFMCGFFTDPPTLGQLGKPDCVDLHRPEVVGTIRVTNLLSDLSAFGLIYTDQDSGRHGICLGGKHQACGKNFTGGHGLPYMLRNFCSIIECVL